jgi:hypothetical protein
MADKEDVFKLKDENLHLKKKVNEQHDTAKR